MPFDAECCTTGLYCLTDYTCYLVGGLQTCQCTGSSCSGDSKPLSASHATASSTKAGGPTGSKSSGSTPTAASGNSPTTAGTGATATVAKAGAVNKMEGSLALIVGVPLVGMVACAW
jgi:hypothetical protein